MLAMNEFRLRRAFHFNWADLDANQHGYMTKDQRVRLRHKRWERLVHYPFLALFILFPAVMLMDNILTMTLGICLSGPLIVSMVYLCFLEWRTIKNDLYKGDVNMVVGCLGQGLMDGIVSSTGYRFDAQGITFYLSKTQLRALRKGERYRFYYAPNLKVILSVETM
jgi:hypothetical protein